MERKERPTGAEDTTMTAVRPYPELEGVRHRFVDLPRLRMHVAEAGSGEPLLLLHGFPQSWWEWRAVLPRLAEQYRVICPDLRGAGWTDAPSGGYDGEQLLADLVALLDALELDRADLLTHDWSSLVAYQLCLRSPERVGRHLSLSIPPPFFAFDRRILPGMVKYAWFNMIVPVPGLGPLALARGSQRVARYMLEGFTASADAMSDADVETFLAPLREPARAGAGSALYRHFILPEAVRIMRGAYRDESLTTRTLVLIGADDPNMREDFLHGYERNVEETDVEFVPGAAHFVADDRPDLVVERALSFFARPREV